MEFLVYCLTEFRVFFQIVMWNMEFAVSTIHYGISCMYPPQVLRNFVNFFLQFTLGNAKF
jgi:hypothetical protein